MHQALLKRRENTLEQTIPRSFNDRGRREAQWWWQIYLNFEIGATLEISIATAIDRSQQPFELETKPAIDIFDATNFTLGRNNVYRASSIYPYPQKYRRLEIEPEKTQCSHGQTKLIIADLLDATRIDERANYSLRLPEIVLNRYGLLWYGDFNRSICCEFNNLHVGSEMLEN
jgi:hypothetical protein